MSMMSFTGQGHPFDLCTASPTVGLRSDATSSATTVMKSEQRTTAFLNNKPGVAVQSLFSQQQPISSMFSISNGPF